LSKLARRYSVFSKIALECLLPFQPVYSRVPDVGKPIPCHVHAEIQVLVFYELKRETNISIPSVIGTSKATCYLCDLFIKHHGRFLVTKTHGRIHPQWTVPDLKEFSTDSVKSLRRTITLVDKEIAVAKKRTVKWRPHPKESWLDVRLVPSLISGSSVETVRPRATDGQKGGVGEHSGNLSGQLLPVPGQTKTVIKGKWSSSATPLTLTQEAKDIESVRALSGDDAPNGPSLRVADEAYPLGKHISPDFPCRFRSENRSVEIYVEIENPSAGVASFEEVPIDSTSNLADVLDIRALEPNLLREYTVQEGLDEVTVKLRIEVDRVAALQLRWT
jgi:OTT_1508-like deaminase